MAVAEPFWFHVRVPFDHTDAQGRVFYANYFLLIDQACYAFWKGIGLTDDDTHQIEYDKGGPSCSGDVLRALVEICGGSGGYKR